MVYMPDTHSPGWRGSTEARVKELLQAWSRKHGLEESKEESEKKRGVEIIGVFAIPYVFATPKSLPLIHCLEIRYTCVRL